MNFSKITRRSLIGKLLRLPLKVLPPKAQIPILQGVMRGMWWIVGAGDHGYWLGSYEFERQRFLNEHIEPGQVLYDVGAHVGYYTLLAARKVGVSGRVIAFEPFPSNLDYIRRHIRINHLTNVTVIDAAVGDKAGATRFQSGVSTSMGYLSSDGDLTVEVVTLDDIRNRLPPPHVIKIDVEGAEFAVLEGSLNLLKEHSPKVFLATHSAEVRSKCFELLENLGYQLQEIGSEHEWLALRK